MFFYDSLYFLIMIPVMAISFFVQNKLKSKFKKFSKQPLFANLTGKEVAEKAIKAGITTVVFDRNGYLYHGRVKTLADSAREGGLKF